ncbi:MAG: MFS transporter [Actinomycetota bacterium]
MAETSAVPWREVFRGRRGRLTAGLLLLEALFAIQALVVATIMPDIRRDLGMVQLYGLAFTAPSLATIAAIPIAGRAVDRYGPGRILAPALGLFAAGLVVAGTAPAMPVLLIGQFLQGAGAGGLYTLSIGTIAKTYPDRMRARVMALLATMWILPGLVGPGLGALIASTVGWRWAFVAPLPVLGVGWFLIGPSLGAIPAGKETEHLPLRWPLQLMLGAGLAFTSLTFVRWWAIPMLAAGLAIGIPALTRIVPRGTFRARPGLPAAAAAAFLLSFGFLAVDAFVTLMLTEVRGLSLAEASVAITVATLTWAGGSAWQSGRTERLALGRLLSIGVALVAVGEAGVATGLVTTVPVVVAYVGWAIVGAGMGISFPTIPLSAMRASAVGEEAGQVSAVLLTDMLGVATGAGLGGGMIAIARATGAPVTAGLAGAFALGIAAMLVLLVLARRIPGAAPARV